MSSHIMPDMLAYEIFSHGFNHLAFHNAHPYVTYRYTRVCRGSFCGATRAIRLLRGVLRDVDEREKGNEGKGKKREERKRKSYKLFFL